MLMNLSSANSPEEHQVQIDHYAQVIWDYHHLHHPLRKSDCILVLGSNDPRVAVHGAQLFLDGWAPLLIFSGGVGALTEGLYGYSEAEYFGKIALEMGVPSNHIVLEPASTNTGENILFTQKLLAEQQLNPISFIVVQKPYMERRSYATFKKHWPDKEICVSTQPIDYVNYPTEGLPKEDIINVMVGDLQRIREYPKLGFQIPQQIPDEVWAAYEQLVAWGFDKHLISA